VSDQVEKGVELLSFEDPAVLDEAKQPGPEEGSATGPIVATVRRHVSAHSRSSVEIALSPARTLLVRAGLTCLRRRRRGG
jgi:hypothetical protein